MVKQARANATRRRIVDAAVSAFGDIGYTATRLSDIVERSRLSKGAFYYHFETKEAVGIAIVDECNTRLAAAYRSTVASSPPLHSIIRCTFAASALHGDDALVRAGTRILLLGEASPTTPVYETWIAALSTQFDRAADDGDTKPGLRPAVVSETIVCAATGVWAISSAASNQELFGRLAHVWEVLLPTLVRPKALGRYQEFLARELRRHLNGASYGSAAACVTGLK